MVPGIDDMKAWKSIADPEADAVVERFAAAAGEAGLRRLPMQLGRWDPQASARVEGFEPLLADYLDRPYAALPDWVQPRRVLRAQRRFADLQQVVMIVLGAYSLPAVYLHTEITATLMGTGQLIRFTQRRLLETYHFVKAAMTEGALLEDGGVSHRWMRKVRLMHSAVRSLARRQPPTDGSEDPVAARRDPRLSARFEGEPIDQIEMLWVLHTFSWVQIDGLARLGYGLSTVEAEDHAHLWALAGWMIGIDERLLLGADRRPHRVDVLQAQYEAMRDALLSPGDPVDDVLPGELPGRQLVAVLLSVLAEVQRHAVPPALRGVVRQFGWLDAAVQNLPRLLLRKLVGVPAATMLHVGRGPLLDRLIGELALSLIDLRTWSDNVPGPVREKLLTLRRLQPGTAG